LHFDHRSRFITSAKIASPSANRGERGRAYIAGMAAFAGQQNFVLPERIGEFVDMELAAYWPRL
jgi:hypothetical protein